MAASRALFNWSGGKDSALALYKTLQAGDYTVHRLLTTVNKHYRRISQHGIREDLLEVQAESLGIPLSKIFLPQHPSMEEYDTIMRKMLRRYLRDGVSHAIYGDIFLEDLRRYREDRLAEVDYQAVFPIWGLSTVHIVDELISAGFKAVIVCVDERYLSRDFLGRTIDADFLTDLPENTDPCGENGEYHSFVYDGPIFRKPVHFRKGSLVYRTYPAPKGLNACSLGTHQSASHSEEVGFWYLDLLPEE